MTFQPTHVFRWSDIYMVVYDWLHLYEQIQRKLFFELKVLLELFNLLLPLLFLTLKTSLCSLYRLRMSVGQSSSSAGRHCNLAESLYGYGANPCELVSAGTRNWLSLILPCCWTVWDGLNCINSVRLLLRGKRQEKPDRPWLLYCLKQQTTYLCFHALQQGQVHVKDEVCKSMYSLLKGNK